MRGASKATWAIGIAVLMAASAFTVGSLSPLGAHPAERTSGVSHSPAYSPAPAVSASPALYPAPRIVGIPQGSLSSIPAPHVVAPKIHLAHYPATWGPNHIPPGAPIPPVPAGVSPGKFYQTWSDNGSYPLIDGTCVGKWPANGQTGYSNNCYGHDEPAINPFSDLPGSGGNVTWNVTLPVDRSPTQNQSDLYIAIWFGMDLYDPYGYSGQCFLELQLYPDTNAFGQFQSGVWSGFAVAWQIELATGFEDPCFAAPLNIGQSNVPFQMSQGDHLAVRMTGWIGSPYGENISVVDNSEGNLSGFLNLYNTTYHYPLNPAYLANNLDDSLPWSPGGDLPVAFSFETGHTYAGPGNDSYGGCNSGVPPPTSFNPSTPCDSYDPQSWANDTAEPWHFGPVKFFNKATTQTAVQIGMEQDFGGIAWIDPLSLGTCTGRDASAYCSYPWYSFSPSANALEFGATDYYGTTYDFGQFRQYDSVLTTNTAGLGYFPVRNFTVPSPTGSSLSITFAGLLAGGTVHFLNYTLTASTTIAHLPSGSYSINSVANAGDYFSGYSASGAVAMDAAGTAWNSFRLSGTGTITVTFSLVAPGTQGVHLNIPTGGGSVAVSPGFNLATQATYPGLIVTQSAPVTSATFVNGNTFTEAPGMCSIQAYPNPGYNFTGWSFSGGVYVFAPASNYTWINITSAGGGQLTAHFVATPMMDIVTLQSVPATGGTITFNGTPYPSGTVLTVPDGTYSLGANPNSSYAFVSWSYDGGDYGIAWSASMSNFAATTDVVLQNGSAWVYALFHSTPSVTLAVSGSGAGSIAFRGTLHTGAVTLSQVEDTAYPIVAVPASGSFFAGWSVDNPANLSVLDPTTTVSSVLVNGSGTLTGTFTSAAPVAVTFDTTGSGSIQWNFDQLYTGSSTNSTVSPGTYSLGDVPAAGAAFNGWNTTGAVNVVTLYSLNGVGEWVTQYELTVAGAGTVFGSFVNATVPITFVDEPSSTGTVATFTSGSLHLPVDAGTTASVQPGTYSVKVSGGAILSVRWVGTSNLTLSGAAGLTVSVHVAGSGTLYALAISAPTTAAVVAAPTIVEPGVPFAVTATVTGGTLPFNFSFGLSGASAGALSCTPATLSSITHTNSTLCTLSLNTPVNQVDTVFVNITDLANFTVSGNVSVQLFSPPTLTFTSPAPSTQLSSTSPFSLQVNWTNTVPPAALPGLNESIGLIDQATGQYVTNSPTPTNPGLPSLWVPAAATNSITLGPGDLYAAPELPPGSYSIAVSFWSTADLKNGIPTLYLTTDTESITVANVQLLSPADGTRTAAGSVTLAYALDGPGITLAELLVRNQSGPVSTSTLPLQPVTGTGSLVFSLESGNYTATLATFNQAANQWLNSSTTFSVSRAPVIQTPPVYHNSTSIPGYISYVYTGLLILGTLIGLLVMWVATRRRRDPPTQYRPLTPADVPAAVTPGVPQGLPPRQADWDEGVPPRR